MQMNLINIQKLWRHMEGDKSKMESLSGYYELDPDSSMGHAKVTHYDKFSTALGYQATADEPGTIAFGHDAGDESGYTYEWETLTDENGNPKQNEIDGTTNDYTKAPKSVKKKAPYTSAYYNRLVKVADGIDDHDVVVMEQLKQYAEKDASNIGNNIKVYKTDANGNVQLDKDKKPIEETDATTTAQNGSKDAWGKALGAGTFTTGTDTTPTNASISDQLVTGKTLYDYDKPTGTQNYVKANNTTGQNLSALDAQVAANTSTLNDKTHNIKYYSVDETILPKINGYSNEDNDGAKGMGSIAAGFNTHADGIASTVAGSYSGVSNQNSAGLYDLRGATALSYGTFNINQNKDTGKIFSGVANSIIGQANATIDSNAAIIYGAGNTVINSYRAIDTSNTSDTSDTSKFLSKVKQDIKNKDAAAVAKDLQKAVPTSGGQVMVMGGGNNVESAYMTQVVGVGNTVKGNQVQNTKNEWVTDTSDTAIKDYDAETSSQYNYVDGFNNEVINGKHDYVIGANNKLSGDSYDNDKVRPIKRSNRSNIVIGDNHTLTREQNTVIIGSSDTENTQTKARDAVIIGHNANATNDTGADNAVAIGRSATATGGNAVTIGVNTSAGENSITIGSESSAISKNNIAIGRYAKVDGYHVTDAVALGTYAEAQVTDGVAIGSGSKATVAGESFEGYDPATGKNSTADSATWKASNAAVSIGTANGKVTRQINGLAAGTNDTDAVNVAQLKKLEGMKANVDASNIGKNLKGADGKAALTEEITANENAWGTAIGTGEIAKDNGQLVTGKTVYAYNTPVAEAGKNLNYVSADKTTGQNLTTLDEHVKTNADAIGTNTTNITKNAGDITKLTNLSNITNEGQTVIKNLSKDAVKVAAGDRISVAEEVDSTTGNKTYTVSAKNDGKVAAGNQNLVSGDTVNTAINNAITNAGTATDTKLAGKANVDATNIGKNLKGADGKTASTEEITANENAWGTAIGTGEIAKDNGQLVTGKTVYAYNTPVAEAGKNLNYVSADKTTGQNLTTLDEHVKTNADAIGTNTKNITTNTTNITKNAGDITNLKNLSNITNEGRTVIKNLSKDAVKVAAGDRISVAEEVDSTTGNKTYTVSAKNDGKVAAGNQNLVSGDTVNTAINNAITNAGTATDTKLAGKANVDATNIGKNLKGADGNTASAEDITANEKAWGAALGTGDIATPKDMLVTDKAIHDELRPTTDGTYVKGSQTTAENLSKLDAQVKTNADGISTNTTNITKNAGDITKLKNLSNITNEGQTVIKNLSKDAVKVAAGDRISVAEEVDSTTGNKTYTVSAKNDGKVAAGNQNLVSGDTVNTAINNAITNAGTATDTKLAGKANVDASNIGENMKDANGNKASDTEINKNKESWASAIGTNTVAKDNKQLVTSDAVATALEKKADKTYVDQELNKKADKTYVDKQLDTKANKSDVYTKDQTYSKSEVDSKVSDITTGLDGKAGKDLDNISDKGQQVIHNIAKDAVEVVDGTNTTVTKTEGTNTTPTKYAVNVEGKGKVASGDTGLISGDTLYKEVHVDKDGAYIKGSNTVGQNLSTLDTGLKTTSDLIHTNAKGDTIQIGGNSTATKIDISGKDKDGKSTGRVITGVVSDANDPNSAANVGYVNGITSASNEQIYHDMNMQYNHVENDISRAAAGSNALAALHPMQEFDPDDKAQFALGYGHYRNSNAGAVGAFYQPDENSMVNFGVSFGNGDAGINAGVTFKFGPGGSGHHALTKTQMAKVIDAQSKEIDELKKDNADKDKRIDALEQKMTEILAKLDKSKD